MSDCACMSSGKGARLVRPGTGPKSVHFGSLSNRGKLGNSSHAVVNGPGPS